MSKCAQELCPNWTGQGCICDVLDVEHPEPVDYSGLDRSCDNYYGMGQ